MAINSSPAFAPLLPLPRTLEDTSIYIPPPPKQLVALMSRALREDQYSGADADIQDWSDI